MESIKGKYHSNLVPVTSPLVYVVIYCMLLLRRTTAALLLTIAPDPKRFNNVTRLLNVLLLRLFCFLFVDARRVVSPHSSRVVPIKRFHLYDRMCASRHKSSGRRGHGVLSLRRVRIVSSFAPTWLWHRICLWVLPTHAPGKRSEQQHHGHRHLEEDLRVTQLQSPSSFLLVLNIS